ncbi:hypothetical protein [Acinetobacter nosocomialis]|uniref:hypothetical protein n=1 Tax=Acinetobacter nosocomialis TaxID=106654 RepID=UPI00124FA726|nr:hypothetical protein [Acinetobacter nosocomialis]
MDNYKIKVKDEAESKEAQELFFELGYEWHAHGKKVSYLDAIPTGDFGYLVAWKTGCFSEHIIQMGCGREDAKEITLAELRDLVVLKRNDVKDANNTNLDNVIYFLSIDNVIYRWEGKWVRSILNDSEDYNLIIQHGLNPIEKPQDPALISGAEALRALADGKGVDVHESTYKNEVWFNLKDTKFTPAEILAEKVRDKPYKLSFRLKPQTIKLELEIPAPYKAKIGGRDDTSFVLNVGRHQYCYQNEEDYTKARDALEAVFDAALRGTN